MTEIEERMRTTFREWQLTIQLPVGVKWATGERTWAREIMQMPQTLGDVMLVTPSALRDVKI